MIASSDSFITIKNIHWHIQRDFIVWITFGGWRGRKLNHFSESLYSRDLVQIGILCEGDYFQLELENSLYIKTIMNMNLKQKQKKNDFNCNFYQFSLLVVWPNNLLVCLCILIIYGIYANPQRTIIFFAGRKFCFPTL